MTSITKPNKIRSDFRKQFICTKFDSKLHKSDLCLLINCDPRLDASTLTLKLNERTLKNNLEIHSIGPVLTLPYRINNIGLTSKVIFQVLSGNHQFSKKIAESNNFFIILGGDSAPNCPIPGLLDTYFKGQFSILPTNAGFWNFSEIVGKNSRKLKPPKSKLLVLYNTFNSPIVNKPTFTVYIGHHFSLDAERADLILPNASFLEQQSTYLNCFGFVNTTSVVRGEQKEMKRDCELLNYWYKSVNSSVRKGSHINISYNRVIFSKLFIYLHKLKYKTIENEKTIENLKAKKIKIIGINLKVLKLNTDKFFPKNAYEKNSKILMNSILHTKKIVNFIA
mgnify:CR=1 FL=1